MKHKNNKKRVRTFVIAGVALLTVSAAGAGALWLRRDTGSADNAMKTTTKSGVNYGPASPSDNVDSEKRKSGGQAAAADQGSVGGPGTKPEFSVILSRVSQNSSDNSILASAAINGISSGNCTFTFSKTKGGPTEVTSKTQNIEATNSGAMCPPLATTMPSNGQWYATVTVTKDGVSKTDTWPEAIEI